MGITIQNFWYNKSAGAKKDNNYVVTEVDWTDARTTHNTNFNSLGFDNKDYTAKRIHVYKLNFSDLPSNKKRTTLNFSCRFSGANNSSNKTSEDRFHLVITDKGINTSSATPQGVTYASATTESITVSSSFTLSQDIDISGIDNGTYYLWLYSALGDSGEEGLYG